MYVPENNGILDETESLCPICLKVVEARVVVQNQGVYLRKACPDHRATTAYLWPDADHYRWMNAFRLPMEQPKLVIPRLNGCPMDCGLCCSHLRHPTLVEIEVTRRCNLRCPVCFMAAGDAPKDPDMKSLESMYQAILRQSGPQTSIQLTGGEPTTLRNLPEIVHLGRNAGFLAFEVNTNGVVIGRKPAYIEQLAEAGISGIYLQFDGVTDHVHKKIRGAYLLKDKLRAIEHCRASGVQVVLAMTVIWGINHGQLGTVLRFALQNHDVIAGVAFQPAFTSGRFNLPAERRLTMGDVVFMLAEQSRGLLDPYDFWPLGCSNPLCSSATYIFENHGMYEPFTRLITRQEYMKYFDSNSPQGSVFADITARQFPTIGSGLSVVVMNYMDAMSMDLKRLKECSMMVVMEDGRLIPFCAYQLTNLYGERMHSAWGRADSLQWRERGYA